MFARKCLCCVGASLLAFGLLGLSANKARAQSHVPVRTADLTAHDAATVHIDAVHWGHGWRHGYYYGVYRVGYRGWGYRGWGYPRYYSYYPRYYYPRYYGSYYYPSYYSTYYPVSPFAYGLAASTLYPPAPAYPTVAGYAPSAAVAPVPAAPIPAVPSGYYAPYGAYYW